MAVTYTAISYAPVQGFIEKSRKLRDLFGASMILSHLSYEVVNHAHSIKEIDVISPGLINVKKGMPNRILLKGNFQEEETRKTKLEEVKQTWFVAWRKLLARSRDFLEEELDSYYANEWFWEEDWQKWGNHAWELFSGEGETIKEAMESLEEGKLSRDWTAINWVGESSSLSGADAIACPGIGGVRRKPKQQPWGEEGKKIKQFYTRLALISDPKSKSGETSEESQPEGKFIDPQEKLSIPELTKRLVTLDAVSSDLSRIRNFNELVRKVADHSEEEGQWTGWFMGDGDKVGENIKAIEEVKGEAGVKEFSEVMRSWGRWFEDDFEKKNPGRIVYAGGDDFFGVLFNRKFPLKPLRSISGQQILQCLNQLPQQWLEGKPEHLQDLTFSLGFVWAAPTVPQRDILQHCRETEKEAKNQGRDRVAIRVLFSSGQYVQWVCHWDYLKILDSYEDLDGGKNWSHVYGDLAQLEARHAFSLDLDSEQPLQKQEIFDNNKAALEFMEIYFPGTKKLLKQNEQELFQATDSVDRAWAMTQWIKDLITVGWYLCREGDSYGN